MTSAQTYNIIINISSYTILRYILLFVKNILYIFKHNNNVS